MDDFTVGYLECALWSSTDNSREDGGDPLDANYAIEDIDPDSLAKMVADCEKFQSDNESLIDQAWDIFKQSDSHCGHDFWLTRNGHGAGFWDGDYGEGVCAKGLTFAAEAFGECWLIVGDDGKIYLG
jgi:hypothetical protein